MFFFDFFLDSSDNQCMSNEFKGLVFRCIPVVAILLATQGIMGCVGSNEPEPVAAVPEEIAQPIPSVTPTTGTGTGNQNGLVTATATVTASGVVAKSSAISIFASIGETGSPSIQRSAEISKVSGVGSLAFTGSAGDAPN